VNLVNRFATGAGGHFVSNRDARRDGAF
jgi:hypothetical protein